MPRPGTSTSNFGAGKRENHDASGFYARFKAPELSRDDHVDYLDADAIGDPYRLHDARAMDLPDNCVALVVTSPPYFVGKQYEEAIGSGAVPASYLEFLQLLRDVFAECKRVLEPGGRIAVNVANLGRKPYRSLAGDVIDIFDDLGLLLRGEVIWRKGEGAAGSCAWGSYRSAANPVLRDVTERVVIASKGRFDRARTKEQRQRDGLPWRSTLSADEFMEATLDVWDIAPESARRVKHPAPFPVELPERLIHLYTFADDLVMDPFMGSGSTLVGAARTGRRFVGFDTDPAYVDIARQRVRDEGARDDDTWATDDGSAAVAVAKRVVEEAGFAVLQTSARVRGSGVTIDIVGRDADGRQWYFDVTGAFTTTRGGLARSDVLFRALGRAHVIANHVNRGANEPIPFVILTSSLPRPKSEGWHALHAAGPAGYFDAIDLRSVDDAARLAKYAKGGMTTHPLPGWWSEAECGGR